MYGPCLLMAVLTAGRARPGRPLREFYDVGREMSLGGVGGWGLAGLGSWEEGGWEGDGGKGGNQAAD